MDVGTGNVLLQRLVRAVDRQFINKLMGLTEADGTELCPGMAAAHMYAECVQRRRREFAANAAGKAPERKQCFFQHCSRVCREEWMFLVHCSTMMRSGPLLTDTSLRLVGYWLLLLLLLSSGEKVRAASKQHTVNLRLAKGTGSVFHQRRHSKNAQMADARGMLAWTGDGQDGDGVIADDACAEGVWQQRCFRGRCLYVPI